MRAIGVIFASGLASIIIWIVYSAQRYRRSAIQALAANAGFHYLGDALPRSLTLGGTPFERVTAVWNVIDGEPRGVRVIAFDCRVGAGKRSWTRTVIAVESRANDVGIPVSHHDLTLSRSGKWLILYRPKAPFELRMSGLIPVEELDARLRAIGK